MTLADLMDYLRETRRAPGTAERDRYQHDVLLLAYDLGLEQGRKEAHGAPSDGR